MKCQIQKIRPFPNFFRNNRKGVYRALKSSNHIPPNSFILLKGAEEIYRYDDDQTYDFQQESNFWWFTGVDQPGCYALLNIDTEETRIYIQDIPEAFKVWMKVLDPEDYLRLFEIDSVHLVDDLEQDLLKFKPRMCYLVGGANNPYSGRAPLSPDFPWLSKLPINRKALFPITNELRVRKTKEEIRLLKHSADIASRAHVYTLQNAKVGMTEKNIQSLFRYFANWWDPYTKTPYEEIVAGNNNAAVLHYHGNKDEVLDGSLVLMDAGTKLNHFCSDITSTFPINGKYTQKQKDLYNVVLEAQLAVFREVKIGVNYQELQTVAELKILEGLVTLGLVKGATAAELLEKRVIYYFFPHGIGHYIGINVHDYPGDPKFENEGFEVPKQNMRIRRVLEEGMVFTNEPGIYFIDTLLKQAKEGELTEFFDWDLIDEYRKEVSGIRIEDMFVVNEQGCDILTHLPRRVEDVEKVMAGEEWIGNI